MLRKGSALESEYCWYTASGVPSSYATLNTVGSGFARHGAMVSYLLNLFIPVTAHGPNTTNISLFDWYDSIKAGTPSAGLSGVFNLMGGMLYCGPVIGPGGGPPGGSTLVDFSVVAYYSGLMPPANNPLVTFSTIANQDLTAIPSTKDWIQVFGSWYTGGIGINSRYEAPGLVYYPVTKLYLNVRNHGSADTTGGYLRLLLYGLEG